jgi:hypothetical protein
MQTILGTRCLDSPNDYVRIEIEAALKRDIRLVPVLVDGARMPAADDLPEPLRPLSGRNAVEITHHRFGAEVEALAGTLQRALGGLHDFGQGWGFVWPFAILSVLYKLSLLAGPEDVTVFLGAVFLTIYGIIGCIRGTCGSNQYGPDPLSRRDRRK